MNVFRLGSTVNEIGRAREIIGVAVKYGFNDWVTKSGFGRLLVSKRRLARIESFTKWERIRMAVEELGPTFIKFGQLLADRPDVVPEELRIEFRKLQDEAVPMPDNVAITEIERNLKHPISEVFSEFDTRRLASASVAQTYKARLLNGEAVCVKVQRPGIDKKIKLDLNLMKHFAARSQRTNPEMEAINLLGLVEEFGKTINKELDFRHEAANVVRFSHYFEKDPDIYVPKIFQEYTTEKILVEEFIEGIKVRDMDALIASGSDPVDLAHKAVRLVFEQIFTHEFFHADPHPGNIFIKDKHVIAFIDYGMMGTIRQEHLHFLGKYVIGYIRRDAHMITESLLLISGRRNFRRFKDLEFQISEMMAHYKFLSIEEMDFGKIMNESLDIIVSYGLRIPAGIYLLVKALITIERVAVTLNPAIDFTKEMQPYAMRLIWQQYDPKRYIDELLESLKEYYKLIKELPSDLNEIIHKIKEGNLRTMVEVKGFEPLAEHIDQASNRISIAIVIASLIIGASVITQWQHTRWLGTIVFFLSGIFGFWLLFKLFRRNRF